MSKPITHTHTFKRLCNVCHTLQTIMQQPQRLHVVDSFHSSHKPEASRKNISNWGCNPNIEPVSDEKKSFRGLPTLTGHHNRGSKYFSWKYSPNADSSKHFLDKSIIGNWMISFYNFLPTYRLLFSMPRWPKKDPRVENANQGALGFPVVLAMLVE